MAPPLVLEALEKEDLPMTNADLMLKAKFKYHQVKG